MFYNTSTMVPTGSPLTAAGGKPFLATSTPAPMASTAGRSGRGHAGHSHSHSRQRRRKEKSPSRKKIELRERTGMAIEIDSDDENDWDRGAAAEKVWGNRKGPMRERPVDDILISFSDLFPCFSPLFESCGCVKKRPKRMLQGKKPPTGVGPRLETVCVDCGNVLDQKQLSRTIGMDMFDRHTPEHHQAFLHGVIGANDSGPANPAHLTYAGYQDWTVQPAPDAGFGGTGYAHRPVVPLPQFDNAPSRIFLNPPETTVARSHAYEGEEGGGHYVELPEFPVP